MAPDISCTRNQSIDLIKIISMVLVVLLHTATTVTCHEIPSLPQILYSFGVIAIPLFFMVSGYLLIGRMHVGFRYSMQKIFRILRFVFVIDFLFGLVFCTFNWWSVSSLIFNFCGSFFQMGYFWFFWYLGAMIIIYLLYPAINWLFSIRSAFLTVLAFILLIQNGAFISNILGVGESDISQTLRLWNWLAYFMLGGLMKVVNFHRPVLWRAIPLSVAATAVTMIWIYPYMHTTLCEYFYCSPAVVVLCCNCFLLLKSCRFRNSRFISECSAIFLPVYTIHPIVIIYIKDFFHGYIDWLGTFTLGCVGYWLTVLLISCIIGFAVMKTPYLKEIFKL